MAYLLLEDFKFGLDSRRFKLNAPPGTLTVLTNGHITPGGEIEKRKAFENFYLPPDTFGLEVTSAGFEVYGSKAQSALTAGTQVATTKRSRSSNVATLTFAADPNITVGDIVTITSAGGTGYNASQVTVTAASAAAPWTISYANTGSNEAETTDTAGRVAPVLPVNVTYVRLQHPDDANAVMTQVIHSTVYNGAAFVIADYGADGIVSFYDETAVDDLSPGRLANILADADALATYIAAQLDATDTYAASASAGTVTVTGPTGQTFSVEYGPLGSNGAYESPCTTPLDTTPPSLPNGTQLTNVIVDLTAFTKADGFYYIVGGVSQVIRFKNAFPAEIDCLNTTNTADLTTFPATLATWQAGDSGFGFFNNAGSSSGTLTAYFYYANGAVEMVEVAQPASYYHALGSGTILPAATSPTITTSVISDGVQPVSGTIPQTQYSVIAVKSGGTGKVTSVTIGGTEVLRDAVNYPALEPATELDGTNYATTALLAAAIKNQINAFCVGTSPTRDFSASVYNTVVVIRATDPTGYEALTNATVIVTVDDDVCVGNGGLAFSQANGTPPTWTSVLANGVDILGATVNFSSDMPTSVAAVATQINTYSSDYTAVARGSILFISKLATSSGDAPVLLSATGTDLNWALYNEGGGNGGVNGGGLPGSINVSPNDLAVRFNQNGGEWLTSPTFVTIEGGLAPFTYAWELTSGEATKELYLPAGAMGPTATFLRQTTYAESPTAPSTVFRVSNTQVNIPALANTTTWRCRVTDSLSRIGYSPSVTVHSP